MIIDDMTPYGAALVTEKRNELLLQQGGICTRMDFSSIDEMDLKTFVEREVPRIKEHAENAYMLRDSIDRSVTCLYNDHAIKFNDVTLSDLPLREVSSHMKVDNVQKLEFGSPYPLLQYWKGDGRESATVLLNNYSFMMQFKGGGQLGPVYMPPMAFRVQLSAGSQEAWVGALPDITYPLGDSEVCSLMFPNVFDDTSICLGNTVVNDQAPDGAGIGWYMSWMINRVFHSEWNTDL